MDIDQLSELIRAAVLMKDEVYLPGFGCFVAEEVAASFSDKGFTVNPPYRKLSFRPHASGDTSLVDGLAAAENISREEALAQLQPFAEKLKELLKQRKSIIFPNLGWLRATKENHFFFVCDENIMIYPDGFGLEPVSLKSHDRSPMAVEAREQSEALKNVQLPQISTPAPAPVTAEPGTGESHKMAVWVKRTVIGLLILFIAVCVVLFLLSRLAPEVLDKLLYTEEQLRIIYY